MTVSVNAVATATFRSMTDALRINAVSELELDAVAWPVPRRQRHRVRAHRSRGAALWCMRNGCRFTACPATLLAGRLIWAASAIEAPGEASATAKGAAFKRIAKRLTVSVARERFTIPCLFIFGPSLAFQFLQPPLRFVLSSGQDEGEHVEPEVAGISPEPCQVLYQPA